VEVIKFQKSQQPEKHRKQLLAQSRPSALFLKKAGPNPNASAKLCKANQSNCQFDPPGGRHHLLDAILLVDPIKTVFFPSHNRSPSWLKKPRRRHQSIGP
jgi:hypothetical protein